MLDSHENPENPTAWFGFAIHLEPEPPESYFQLFSCAWVVQERFGQSCVGSPMRSLKGGSLGSSRYLKYLMSRFGNSFANSGGVNADQKKFQKKFHPYHHAALHYSQFASGINTSCIIMNVFKRDSKGPQSPRRFFATARYLILSIPVTHCLNCLDSEVQVRSCTCLPQHRWLSWTNAGNIQWICSEYRYESRWISRYLQSLLDSHGPRAPERRSQSHSSPTKHVGKPRTRCVANCRLFGSSNHYDHLRSAIFISRIMSAQTAPIISNYIELSFSSSAKPFERWWRLGVEKNKWSWFKFGWEWVNGGNSAKFSC